MVNGRRYSVSAEGIATDVTEQLVKENGHWVYYRKDGTILKEEYLKFYSGTVSVPEGATAQQAAVVRATNSTPSPGAGYCAAWVTWAFRNAGIGYWTGDACDMYWRWCKSADPVDLQPGMIIAVPTEPLTYAAQIYGHIGIYVGNGLVMQSVSGRVRYQTLPGWIRTFGTTSTVKWGWLGGKALA